MPHWFFFSHAGVNRTRELMAFFQDLAEALNPRLTKEELEETPFADWRMGLMRRWNTELQAALESSRILVCATSPAYVEQEWCGKEVAFFEKLVQHHRSGATAPADVILPVIWYPAENGLPSILSERQFNQDSLPEEYVKTGIYKLMIFKSRAYQRCVEAIADEIVLQGKRNPPCGGVPNLSLGTTKSAFDLKQVHCAKVVYFAGTTKDEFIADRDYAYGSSGSREWKPFLPPPERNETVADLVESVLAQNDLAFEELGVTSELLDTPSKLGSIALLVVDPWTMQSEWYKHKLASLTFHDNSTNPLFVLWNNQDPQLMNRQSDLKRSLRECFDGGSLHDCELSTPEEFQRVLDEKLKSAMTMIKLEIARSGSKERDVTDRMPRINPGSKG